MKKLLYLFVKFFLNTISRWPLWLLYGLSALLFVLLYYIVPYRRKVVGENMERAFPHKSLSERKAIAKAFYSWFGDVMVESIKAFTCTKEMIAERCVVLNPEVTFSYHEQGQSILIVGAHFGNWEWAALTTPSYLKHECAVVYKKQQNTFVNDWMVANRSRFGSDLVEMKSVGRYTVANKRVCKATILLMDQRPQLASQGFWLSFFNHPAPFLKGMEKLALKFNQPVFYTEIKRVKRGYYEATLKELKVSDIEIEGSLTKCYAQHLEKSIESDPATWLWTHKRWKHKLPEDT